MTTTKSTKNTPPAAAATTASEAAAPVPVSVPVASKARRPRKTNSVEQTVAKHQQALAAALEKAEAISYEAAPVAKAAKAAKPAKPAEEAKARPEKAAKVEKVEKPVKAKKPRLVRDSYAMPEAEYAQIPALKKRLAGLGSEVKKSELLRAGIAVLAALGDAELQAVLARVERIKTGRPAKK